MLRHAHAQLPVLQIKMVKPKMKHFWPECHVFARDMPKSSVLARVQYQITLATGKTGVTNFRPFCEAISIHGSLRSY